LMTLAARELGRWLGRRNTRKQAAIEAVDGESAEEVAAAEGYIIGSIFGLLALMVGFTFSIAQDRFDNRRAWSAQEATAIATTYMRADLFDEPERTRLRSTIRAYTQLRVSEKGNWDEAGESQLAASDRLRPRLWSETRVAVYPYRTTELGSYFVEAVNEMLETGTRRAVASRAYVPARIINVLILYLLVASATLGFLMGDRRGLRLASTLLLALFVLAISLILDLDRPRAGAIRVPQRALLELVAGMNADARRGDPAPSAPPGTSPAASRVSPDGPAGISPLGRAP
ncbi:MAG: hypothetical protein ACJ8DZ_04660, partial [Allosphingosinicella sp.]